MRYTLHWLANNHLSFQFLYSFFFLCGLTQPILISCLSAKTHENFYTTLHTFKRCVGPSPNLGPEDQKGFICTWRAPSRWSKYPFSGQYRANHDFMKHRVRSIFVLSPILFSRQTNHWPHKTRWLPVLSFYAQVAAIKFWRLHKPAAPLVAKLL